MNHEYIVELLEQKGDSAILLDGCVLNIKKGRSLIYVLFGDTDYEQKDLEICYADNHSDVIWKGLVKTKEELKEIIINLEYDL